ncbi:hypothetical protein PANTOEA_08375 [Pantoea dispersa]|uniref:hypothetical protein n=1 Tax=Pantoea TaxID=53335 RepID=UPI0011AFF96F|nr:hypothetical protein [Pantoea agglomerans]UBN55497.1 hypothetical protein LB453_08095 [Pantoea agglomerans]
MEIDKLNTFLATALGGLMLKWLVSTIKAFWNWVHKVYPEENFLVDELGINAPLIRFSYCKYKKNIKPRTARQLSSQVKGGIAIAIFFLLSFIWIAHLFSKLPLESMEVTMQSSQDTIWIRPGKAQNPQGAQTWSITPDICKDMSELNKIKSIKTSTKESVCDYMLIPEKMEKLKDLSSKNYFFTILLISVILPALLYLASVGVAMVIDVSITKKIFEYNKRELSKIASYIT